MSDDADSADQLSASRERGAVIAGRYRIEREIGRGGMATVFLAHDIKHDRSVALKFIHAEVADGQATERFRREIALLAQLQHPHILPLYDSGESEGALYYVMPYIAGESLRARLTREKQLPVADAIQLAREIAGALAYAHAHGVIHRDIKPENILLSEGHALVGDFGIAQAVSRAGGKRLTDAGFAVGTLSYMSPEQGSGDAIDGRSDLYSLGTVVYEMITGKVPFSGPTAVAVLAKRFSDPAIPLRQSRPTVPVDIDDAVVKALASDPKKRFQTITEFGDALARGSAAARPRGRNSILSPRVRWVLGGIGLAAIIALVIAFKPAPLDPELFVVLPFVHRANAAPQLLDGDNCQQLLYEAFGRWNGVTLVDDMRAHDARARGGNAPLSLDDALRTARSLHAGRLAWGEVWMTRDSSIDVRGLLYEVRTGQPIKQYTVNLRADLGDAERRFDELADSLIIPLAQSLRATLPSSGEGVRGTRSIPALTAYFRAHEALAAWQLDSAEQLFRAAIDADPEYPHANFWLAQVMAWRGDAQPPDWLASAQRAMLKSGRLSQRDSILAGALLDMAQGKFPEACARYERLRASRDSLDFAVWYGLGDCRARDTVIVRSAASPSGYRFRSSYEAAIRAYTRALTLVPSAHRAFAGIGFERLAILLFTQSNQFRSGAVAGDSATWVAYPYLSHDTLAFDPYPIEEIASGKISRPTTTSAAVGRNRAVLERLATSWTQDFPRSAEAYETLAHVLELQGRITGSPPDVSALATLDRAREFSADRSQALRLGVMRTRLLLVTSNFAGARALADSLLAATPGRDTSVADVLKPLAALTGHMQRTLDLMRAESPGFRYLATNGHIVQPPLQVTEAARTLLGYVSFGAPADSIGAMHGHVERALESYVPVANRTLIRDAVLNLPLTLAYPVVPLLSLQRRGGGGDYLLDIQRSAAKRDTAAVREQLRTISRARRLERPGELSTYLTYQEAWLSLQAGDTASATRELDASLNALPSLDPHMLDFVQDVAFLVRAMALRSDLAFEAGDMQTSKKWAAAVAELWSGADAPLRDDIVSRMRARVAGAVR